MSLIELQPITAGNWKACINLRLNLSQAHFLPSNLYSIAEAQFYPDAQPYAIYNGQDQMVGFLLYGKDIYSGRWKIFRLMIDEAHQRCGYARAAMQAVIERLVAKSDCQEIVICYQRENPVARLLYQSLGFIEQQDNPAVDHFTATLPLLPRS